jgi:hypothetical protein
VQCSDNTPLKHGHCEACINLRHPTSASAAVFFASVFTRHPAAAAAAAGPGPVSNWNPAAPVLCLFFSYPVTGTYAADFAFAGLSAARVIHTCGKWHLDEGKTIASGGSPIRLH